MSGLINDSTFDIARLALDGLSRRQELIGTNLANVDTPGYHAQTNNFESTLQRAIKQDLSPLRLAKTNAAHLASPTDRRAEFGALLEREGGSERADGNNVNIDVELMQQAETGIKYQALTQTVSKKLLLLRAIATGR
jgi:flagellar basal-body rod protein FlgB